VGIFSPFISTQHTLKKANLLSDYIDRLFSRHRLGNWCCGLIAASCLVAAQRYRRVSTNKSIGSIACPSVFA
jgi:hypothetical protein